MLQERQREELLRATMPSSTPGQVQINLGNEQADLRHFKRLNHTNNGKLIISIFSLYKIESMI
jgi:hypothetical protein